MSKKTIADYEKRATELKAQQQETITDLESKLATAREMLESAGNNVTDAYKGTDAKAYHKAKDKHREASDLISMYEDKLNEVKESPVISKAEYEEVIADVMTELAKEVQDAKESLVKIIDKMKPIKENLEAKIEQGNKILNLYQVELYKDEKFLTAKNQGRGIFYLKKFNDTDVQDHIDENLTSDIYAELRGKMEPKKDEVNLAL